MVSSWSALGQIPDIGLGFASILFYIRHVLIRTIGDQLCVRGWRA